MPARPSNTSGRGPWKPPASREAAVWREGSPSPYDGLAMTLNERLGAILAEFHHEINFRVAIMLRLLYAVHLIHLEERESPPASTPVLPYPPLRRHLICQEP